MIYDHICCLFYSAFTGLSSAGCGHAIKQRIWIFGFIGCEQILLQLNDGGAAAVELVELVGLDSASDCALAKTANRAINANKIEKYFILSQLLLILILILTKTTDRLQTIPFETAFLYNSADLKHSAIRGKFP